MERSINEIAEDIPCSSKLYSPSLRIKNICVDSRFVISPAHTLFIALKGAHTDGHAFIQNLYATGVRNFIVSNQINTNHFPQSNFLFVDSGLDALQALARAYRRSLHMPLIAIAGSVGKTVVKEWLYAIVCRDKKAFRSPRSYNSQIGVPLSLLQISEDIDIAIIEAGISQTGEMERLKNIICPSIGVLTEIGSQHNEGFVSEEKKAEEKIALFTSCEKVVCCKSDAYFKKVREILPKEKLFIWGGDNDCDIRIESLENLYTQTRVSFTFQGKTFESELLSSDKSYVHNWFTALSTLAYLGYDIEKILPQMRTLPPISMKLEIAQLASGSALVFDSNNMDIYSVLQSIHKLEEQRQHTKFTIILSEVEGANKSISEKDMYTAIVERCARFPALRLVLIGKEIARKMTPLIGALPISLYAYDTLDLFIKDFSSQAFINEGILVKLKKREDFLAVNELLVGKTHSTILEIHLTKLKNNLSLLLSRIDPQVKVMAMVKAFSYGSGSYEIARLIQRLRVDYLAVAYADEAIDLRLRNISMPIMVMNMEPASMPLFVKYDLEPVAYSVFVLQQIDAYCKANAISRMPIHLEIETGMHRLGVDEEELSEIKSILERSPHLVVKSVYSHFVASEDVSQDYFSAEQVRRFKAAKAALGEVVRYPFLTHMANSAASFRLAQYHFDMVRIGIGMYGYDPGKTIKGLEPIFRLKTNISQIKRVRAGERVSYGNYVLAEDKTIATIRIGYADGFARSLSDGVGRVIIKGIDAPVVGKVCMDMTMVDVSRIPQIHIDDEVEIFGDQLSFVDFCEAAKRTPYEAMVSFPARVRRIYIEE